MSPSRRNMLSMVLIDTIRVVALLCATGTLMQTFLSTLGFREELIYLHSTLMQAGQICSILLCSRWADRGNVFRKAGCVLLVSGGLFFCYIPLCLSGSASPESFSLLLLVGVVQMVCIGLYTVCYYKLPYYIYEEKDFGTVLSWTGVISGGISFLVGGLVSALSEKIPYTTLMLAGFLVSGVLMLLSVVLQLRVKAVRQPAETQKQERVPLKAVLLAPLFRNLLIPNLMRGFSSGAISVLPVMALSLGYGPTFAASLVSACAAATLTSCALFGLLNSRLRSRRVILLGSLAYIGLLLMLIPGAGLFFAAYCLVIFGRNLVDNAVPALLLQTVPAGIAGPYNAWRMIVHLFGTLLGTAAATVIPIPIMLILSAALQVLSGSVYFRIMNREAAAR